MKRWESYLQNDVVQFLSLDEAIAIHSRLIEKFGGPSGIRDLGLLESALFRPQTGYYDNLVYMSAALFESLFMNHPFIDGNERAAFFITDVFLRVNGMKLSVEANAAHGFIINKLELKHINLEIVYDWIQENVIKR